MRILLSVDPEIPVPPKLYGGIERIVHSLIEGLVKRGHQVGLLAHPESETAAQVFFPWEGKHSNHLADTIRNTSLLWRAVRQFRPDVVHSFSRLWYLAPLLIGSLPKVMSYQRHPNQVTVSWAARLGGTSLRFTGCSEHICERGRPAGGTWLPIHNFVDLNTYTFQETVAPDAPLVFLSRVERIKGAHTAIAAALKTNRRLMIAGNHANEGDEFRYWKEKVEPHLGKNGIEYVGPVNDGQKDELLGKALGMVVPIEWDEPFGIVFAEALACGTPVISSPRGALPEIVTHGETGFLCRTLDEICQGVESLSGLHRGACRQRAELCFSAPVVVNQYEALYQHLVE
ncbi:MAG: glycosyltransferase [Blastocatellia bacterium]|nr:glycosyltransferase [Blastocatellia bacterium]